jgi:tetratricopeptide (TPR) repeat protein
MSAAWSQIGPMPVPVPAGEIYVIATEYVEAGRLDAADRLLGHILAATPTHAESLHLSGLIAFRRGRMEDSAALMERAARAGARKAVHLRNLAEVYRQVGRLDEGADVAERALNLDRADPLAAFNLAMVQYDRLRIPECVAAAREALRRKPDLPEAQMKLAQALLVSGDFAPGWEAYEFRYRIPGAAPLMPPTTRPQWDGAPMPGGRLLLVADQGYGDVIMFGRLASWAQSRCANVTVACSPEMRGIVEQLVQGATIAIRWEDCQDHTAYCPFSGLPRLSALTLASLPGSTDYLRADPALVSKWAARLDAAIPAGLRRVALSWAGRPTHNNDRNRSLHLRQLQSLANTEGVAFISLQKGPAAAQCAEWTGPAPLLNLDAEIQSFEDTAAILQNIDLSLSVDTSVAHLAGALGRTAWVMLPYAPDWRWLLDREDTPWYPSMRLFRQSNTRDWPGVIARVTETLKNPA